MGMNRISLKLWTLFLLGVAAVMALFVSQKTQAATPVSDKTGGEVSGGGKNVADTESSQKRILFADCSGLF